MKVRLPTHYQAESVDNLAREIEEFKLDLSIAVVDDPSPDRTAEIVKGLHEEYGNIHLISRSKKLRSGTAITTGFQHIFGLKRVPSFIVTTGADYSHNPRDIPRMVEVAKKGCDLAIEQIHWIGKSHGLNP